MGFLDFIPFFKKKEEFLTDMPPLDPSHSTFETPTGLNPTPNDPLSLQGNLQQPLDDHRMRMPLGDTLRHPAYDQQQEPVERHNPLQKDLELISSKLDYLKASLDAINQRLANLEHYTRQEIDQRRW